MSRRDQVVDAAIEVLAERGGRGLSHRAVDEAAGVPLGTAANYFPSRRKLLVGIFDRLVERNTTGMHGATMPAPRDEEELVRSLGTLTRLSLGESRAETLAFGVLVFEAAVNADLAERFIPLTTQWRRLYTEWLTALGASDPDTGATLLSAYIGALLVTENVDPSPTFDPETALEPLVWGLLHEPSSPAGGPPAHAPPR